MIITIDGLVATGKSTVAKLLAAELDYVYLASGALYRAVAYLYHDLLHVPLNHFNNITEHELLITLEKHPIIYRFLPKAEFQLLIENRDCTARLHASHIDNTASMLALNANVRSFINSIQKKLVADRNAVIDGRDAGNHVFKMAEYKFFLTADQLIRINRYIERQKHDYRQILTMTQAKELVSKRDNRDLTHMDHQNNSDVIIIDSTDLSIPQVVALMKEKMVNYADHL